MPSPALPFGVVGAGLAGLAAARTLRELGHPVMIFDKGRGPGGRCSSRRAEPFAFDHGAQYFTVRDERFARNRDRWLADGVAAPWDGRIVTLREGESEPVRGTVERLVGTPRMSALARDLARGLDLRARTSVAELVRAPSCWRLVADDGRQLGEFARLIVALPPRQAARLVADTSPQGALAAEIGMQPCWAVMLGLSKPYTVDFDGAFCTSELLSWICRDSSKPGRPAQECWVLHATPTWSAERLNAEPETIVAPLIVELERLTGVPLPEVRHRAAHRWGLAQPAEEFDHGFLLDPELRLAIAGDAYAGGRVEGAYLSGVVAAEALVEL